MNYSLTEFDNYNELKSIKNMTQAIVIMSLKKICKMNQRSFSLFKNIILCLGY